MDPQDDGPSKMLTQFTWERQPKAEALIGEFVNEFLNRCPEAAALAEQMRTETGTRFGDWVDSMGLPWQQSFSDRLLDAGYVRELVDEDERGGVHTVHEHPGGVFPRVVLTPGPTFSLWIKVDSVADYFAANPSAPPYFLGQPIGQPLSSLRLGMVWPSSGRFDGTRFSVVERHGNRSFRLTDVDNSAQRGIECAHHLERFRWRHRVAPADEAAFDTCEALIDHAIADLGQDPACDLFFIAEREYWQRRNRAAQYQKARQDRLGLGWANHDHHTYRCSRKHFARLIALWEKLGFRLRERFYAGAQAGWGAQICEQPNAGIITFNDVDLSPDELINDFAHDPLPERHDLGTVGLWCALHGESILDAGMHHLECQFDFDALRDQLERDANIKTMKPFTDLPHLRQAFTEGERWPVNENRIAKLLAKNQITPDQAQKFRDQGAIGSHLENLERNEGFKGFNQKGVSDIIAKTDPRNHV